MIIHFHKDIYSVSVYGRQYARINGRWHVHTGGNELQWSPVNKVSMINKLEAEFQIIIRQQKLDSLV